MAFQTTINSNIAFGMPGEWADDGPHRAGTHMINSNGTPNIVGSTACTLVSGTNLETGTTFQASVGSIVTAGGTGVWAGILCDPHVYVNRGTTVGGTLAPTLQVPDGTQVETAVEGALWVIITTTAAVGDILVYNTTTGALSTIANTANPAPATGTALVPGVGGGVVRVTTYPVTVAGLAKVKL